MRQGNLVHRGGGGAPRQHPQQLHQKLKLWRRTVAALPAAQSSQVAAVTTAREESSWKPGDAAVARRKAAPSSAEQRSVRHNGINPLTCTCVRPLPALCARAHTHTHTHTHTHCISFAAASELVTSSPSYTHLRSHETKASSYCVFLMQKKKNVLSTE